MKRAFLLALVALAAFAPLQARATRLTRIVLDNPTGHCMRVSVQQQGPHKAIAFGPFPPGKTFDHIFSVAGDVTPNYFIEVQLEQCGSGKAIYRDFHITDRARDGHIIALKIVPQGSGYRLAPWP